MAASQTGTIRKVFDVKVDALLSPKAMAAAFSAETRRVRDGYIADGSAGPTYQTVVDGRLGEKEENVRIGGSVVYVFNQLGAAVLYAYTFAVARSPARSGRFRGSWVVGVNGQLYDGDLEKIESDALVTLVNIQPYARKIDVGGQKVYIPGSVTDDVRRATADRFPTITVTRQFINLGSNLSKYGIEVPYILRGHAHHPQSIAQRRIRLSRRGVSYHAPSKDTARGAVMTYPAVILSTALR